MQAEECSTVKGAGWHMGRHHSNRTCAVLEERREAACEMVRVNWRSDSWRDEAGREPCEPRDATESSRADTWRHPHLPSQTGSIPYASGMPRRRAMYNVRHGGSPSIGQLAPCVCHHTCWRYSSRAGQEGSATYAKAGEHEATRILVLGAQASMHACQQCQMPEHHHL